MATGADYTYDINGLMIGAGTPYKVMKIDGLFALPDVIGDDEQRENSDGERSTNSEILAGRTVTIDLNILTDDLPPGTTVDDLYEDLQDVTSDIRTPFNFGIKRPGRDERFLSTKIKRRAFVADWEFTHGNGIGSVQLKATDPRIYGSTLVTNNIGLQTLAGGRSYPLAYPRSYGAGAIAGVLIINNDGTYSAPILLNVNGAGQDPIIEHVEQGRVMSFSGISIAAGDDLIIDTLAKTAFMNGASQRTKMLRAEWFLLNKGVNTIRFSSAISGPGQLMTLDVNFRPAWI